MKDWIKISLVAITYLMFMTLIYTTFIIEFNNFISFAIVHCGFSILYFLFVISILRVNSNI